MICIFSFDPSYETQCRDVSYLRLRSSVYMHNVSYASVIRSVMYTIVCSRPDIPHVVIMVSRYMHNPRERH